MPDTPHAPLKHFRSRGAQGDRVILRQTIKVAIVAVMMLASLLSSTAAVEDNPAVHIEADIAKSCYSARIGFGSFWMLGGHSENFLPPTATPRCARGFPDGLTTQSAQIC